MPIDEGTRLGHYEIRSKIGEGGMGEVYLAQDTKLDRTVALKVLPPNLASNRDRMRRFTQEAKAAAALNHPNIAHVYEIGEHDGTHFIAMEFVDGETLRELIRAKPIDLLKLLHYSQQIAEGLAKAHAAGVVHRDLKPDNIMITRDGHAKVLDFGLAKLVEPAVPEVSDPEAPTRAVIKTESRVVMGTAIYMSPEQARGLKVDSRTDIFSFGVLIYEAVTGRLPFDGANTNEILATILSDKEPPLLARYSSNIPAELERIVSKALRKDPNERYQTIRDMLLDLKRLREDLEFRNKLEGSFPPPSVKDIGTQAISGASRASRRTHALALTGGLTLVTLIGIVIAWKYAWPRLVAHNAVTPFAQYKLTPLTTNGKASSAVISPDGKYVVHVVGSIEQKSLWLRHIATGSDKEILPSNGNDITNLSFSPDGNRIYFIRSAGPDVILETIPVLGGPPKEVLHDIDSTASFSPDGTRFAFVRGDPAHSKASVIIANADGSGEQKLVTHEMERFFLPVAGNLAWSVDGNMIAIALRGDDTYRNVFVVNVKDRTEKQITSQQWDAVHTICWLPNGNGFLITAIEPDRRNTQIFYSSYPEGRVERITNDLNNYEDLSVTSDGAGAVTVRSEGESDIWISSIDNLTNASRITSNRFDGVSGLAWTPDGKLVHGSNESGTADLWLMNTDGTDNRQLTANAGLNLNPCVTPDGKYIFFMSNRTGAGLIHIWRINIDGGNPTQMTFGQTDGGPRCTADKQVIFTSDSQGQTSAWRMPVEGGTPTRITDYFASVEAVSPVDSRLVILFLDDTVTPPRRRSGVISASGGRPSAVFDFPFFFGTLGGGFYGQAVRWTADGKALTYIVTKDGISNIWAQPVDGGPKRQMTNFTSESIFNYAWSSDGKKLALARGRKTSDVVLIKDLGR